MYPTWTTCGCLLNKALNHNVTRNILKVIRYPNMVKILHYIIENIVKMYSRVYKIKVEPVDKVLGLSLLFSRFSLTQSLFDIRMCESPLNPLCW